TPLALTDEIKTAVAGAFDNGTPIVVAYVDAEGVPHLSLRGSTQPYSDTQLAMWIRDPAVASSLPSPPTPTWPCSTETPPPGPPTSSRDGRGSTATHTCATRCMPTPQSRNAISTPGALAS